MDRFKLLVVGDCGVGKTSFVHGVVHQSPILNPPSTIGCNVEVLAYNSGSSGRDRDVFLEFWDVGGSSGHRNSRGIFYSGIDGLIVVHDLSNRKSFLNLEKWVREAFNPPRQEFTGITVSASSSGSGSAATSPMGSNINNYDRNLDNYYGSSGGSPSGNADYDTDEGPSRRFNSGSTTPVLVLGTKEDQCAGGNANPLVNDQSGQYNSRHARHIGLTEDSDIVFCSMNCLQEGQLTLNSNKWQSLHTFFQKVIENRYTFGGRNMMSSKLGGSAAGTPVGVGGAVNDSIMGSGGGDYFRGRKKLY